MDITRRQIVGLGATAAAGAIVGKVASGESAAAAGERTGGIHINVLTKAKKTFPDDFPHHWTMTVYGPDNALSGMGWGGTFDGMDLANSHMLQCIFALRGAVQGDVVTLDGPMLFSGDRGVEGQSLHFEANLKTGFLHMQGPGHDGPVIFEGTGSVSRI